jgi:YbbR domain-containing protein
MTQIPTEVKVVLRGPRSQLAELRPDDLGSLQLDLRSGRETNIVLMPSMFQVPSGLRIEEIHPANIDLRWDDVIVRAVPVQVARTGEPAAGFTVKGTTVIEPPVVSAHGPSSIVDVIQHARAAAFDVTGLTEGVYRRPLALDKPPKLVTYDVENVIATLEITRELSSKQLAKLKVEVVGLPRATTTPGTVSVIVTGVAEDINALTPEAIVPRVEPKAANIDTTHPGGSAYVDVLVDIPRTKVEIRPPKVLLKW